MTIEQAYIETILRRVALSKHALIEQAIRDNAWRRTLENESECPLNRRIALRGTK
jgi:hypothetical protein